MPRQGIFSLRSERIKWDEAGQSELKKVVMPFTLNIEFTAHPHSESRLVATLD